MKRPLLAMALAGAIGLLPGAGHAQSINVVSCTVTGSSVYESPVTFVPLSNATTFTGQVTCYQGATDGSVATGDTRAGELAGSISGAASCIAGSSNGEFSVSFLTGEDGTTRDYWTGQLSQVGGALSALLINPQMIEHQTFDADLGEWVTDSVDNLSPAAAAGTVKNNADIAACETTGVSASDFDGSIVGAFVATPDATE